jgi:hypothetical protein
MTVGRSCGPGEAVSRATALTMRNAARSAGTRNLTGICINGTITVRNTREASELSGNTLNQAQIRSQAQRQCGFPPGPRNRCA